MSRSKNAFLSFVDHSMIFELEKQGNVGLPKYLIMHPNNATSIANTRRVLTSAAHQDREHRSTATTDTKAQQTKPRERRLGFINRMMVMSTLMMMTIS